MNDMLQRVKARVGRGRREKVQDSSPTHGGNSPKLDVQGGSTQGQVPSFPDGVKVLHDCPGAVVDICFVHGLTGDRESTWTAAGHSTPWPKTLLPQKLDKARILTYGYDAYVVRKGVASSNRLIDHATNLLNDLAIDRDCSNASSRPLIFVAHSLGGLVCKEAILLSRNNPETHLQGIFNCSVGIIFMGTPHKGSWMADWTKIPASALGLVKSVSKSLLEILQTDNQALELIQVSFWSMIRERQKAGQPPEVTCFFEELPFPGVGEVVSKKSATLEGYSSFSIHANHRDMVKFTSVEENGFKRLLWELTRWKSQIVHSLSKPPQSSQGCLRSLAFPQMQNRFHEIDRAVTGTCEWLLKHDTYKSWAACDRSLLWIKGKPGSGKSTLPKYALDNYKAKDALVLSFFFHGRGDKLQKTPLGLFRSLLYQVLRLAPQALLGLVDTFERRCQEIGEPGEKWKWHLEELQRFFESSLSKVLETRPVWLFVDALDECGKENAVNLVEIFKTLLKNLSSQPNALRQFQICFACRHYPILDLDIMFEIYPERENGEDISTFVDDRLSAFRVRTPSTIPALITKRATGVFMWAHLVVKRVLDLEREGVGLKKIEAEINSIHPELDELYDELIQNMKSASLKLIQWVCFAKRPLSIIELRWAMVIDADCPHLSLKACQIAEDIADIEKLKRQVQTLSCGLAEVTHMQAVQFIHQSVKDFFVEKGLLMLDRSLMSIDAAIGMAHFRLSMICIRYLTMEEIRQSSISQYSDFPFLDYAIDFVVTHIKQCDDNDIPQEHLLMLFDCLSHAFVELWVRVYKHRYLGHQDSFLHSYDFLHRGTSLVRITSRYGIVRLLMLILQRAEQIGIEIDTKDEDGRTPLWWATDYGHKLVVKLLLENGANIESKDMNGWTPLWKAAENGHEPIVKLSLEQGANIELKDNLGRTPLLRAAENGHEATVKLLLEKGADINPQSDRWKPLSSAAKNGHEATVKLLLEKGADINPQSDGRTPLSRAAENGHEPIVKLLLEEGANIELEDENGWTPLSRATVNGHEATVKLLLEKGADINPQSDSRTPLSRAAENGHEPIVKLLLEQGADINPQSDRRMPLWWAATNGHESVVKLLLKKGANIESKSDDREPLSGAAQQMYEDIATRMLSERGIDIRPKSRYGQTPLSRAAARGHEAVVKLLVEKGANVESKCDGRTPLSRAAENGHEAIVKLLINTGKVDVNSKDRHGKTPLRWAVERGHEAVVTLLLEKGADIKLKDNYDQSPLSRAAERGHEEIF